jgi:selenocysteine-specific elongation factor
MHVLGTAGHVDHGKSSLVLALTGIDPDRLPEEKQRGLTIELGFAWFETDAGPLGVVDVPGHERFVRTMIAGAGGIDIVMFVVAADDGWMPQSQEHLDILRLLDVRTGVIALSKCDLVDRDWLLLVQDELRARTKGTFLEDAPIIPTSAPKGVGLHELRKAIADAQRRSTEKQDVGRARLAIDRVFSMTGQGTVVTGTLRDGSLETDSHAYLFPGARPVRVRGLQTHKHTLDKARPGSRVAANLAGVDKDAVHRGDWLIAEPPIALPRFVGVELEILNGLPFALRSGMVVLAVFGTAEVPTRVILRDPKARISHGRVVAQLDLKGPLYARFGDRFITRLPSPQLTLGGGRFLDPSPHRMAPVHADRWGALERISSGDASTWISARVEREHWVNEDDMFSFFPRSRVEYDAVLGAGTDAGEWRRESGHVIHSAWWSGMLQKLAADIQAYHRAHRSEPGPASAELFAAAGLPQTLHDAVLRDLEKQGVRGEGPYLVHHSHRAGLTRSQTELAERWRTQFAEDPFETPTRAELLSEAPEAKPTLDFLLKSGEWTELKDGVLLRTGDYQHAVRVAVEAIQKSGTLTIATFRDLVGTTRKYALPILDRCDRLGYTKRVGDERVLGPRAEEVFAEQKQ